MDEVVKRHNDGGASDRACKRSSAHFVYATNILVASVQALLFIFQKFVYVNHNLPPKTDYFSRIILPSLPFLKSSMTVLAVRS